MVARGVGRVCALLMVFSSARVTAQSPPPVRQIGRLERITTDSLASVATALPMPGGRVLVNDRLGRRVLLFDSTLSRPTIVADTTNVTANAYGQRPATLIRYRGDSALLIDQGSLSMFVIGPSGTITRVMAIPRPEDAQALMGQAGFDGGGRLVYFNGLGQLPGVLMLGRGESISKIRQMAVGSMAAFLELNTDSAFIVRVDPVTRVLDTVTPIKIPKAKRELKADAQGLLVAIEATPDPLPLVDAWTTLPDGSIAVVRARDYHVDWLTPDGKWSSSPKMPFDWQRVSDERKQTLIDSTVKDWQATYDRVAGNSRGTGAGSAGAGSGRGGGGGGGGRGGSGQPGGAGGGTFELAPTVARRSSLNDVPDYMPPFSMRPSPIATDADGNLWIRTTTMAKDQPVYDVVNRRGELSDRVQLPPFRTIAGFGPGVVYMALKDSAGAVHLERARVR
jgi:uncharacterized membrane protein YgcG